MEILEHKPPDERRIIILSNRLPVTAEQSTEEELTFKQSIGGLSTAIDVYCRKEACEKIWIGWPGIPVEDTDETIQKNIREKLLSFGYSPVFLTREEVEETFYLGACNKKWWPLCHMFPQHVRFGYDSEYTKINKRFADELMKVVRPGDLIWVHDYQLMYVADFVRGRLPEGAKIGFFLHIPFPPLEIFRSLPEHRLALEKLLSFDLVAFQVFRYAENFLKCVEHILGFETRSFRVIQPEHVTVVDSIPIGIDDEQFAAYAADPEVIAESAKIRRGADGAAVILGTGRLDYTKGIPELIQAYRDFLVTSPEYRGKVKLVLVVSPSRTKIKEYDELKDEIERLVGSVNGQFSTHLWGPIKFFNQEFTQKELAAFYKAAHIAAITPIIDGMNLMVMEYVSSRIDGSGVVILGENAGAAQTLTEAILVNPYDTDGFARAIKQGLQMPPAEQRKRMKAMQESIRRFNVFHWADDFLNQLENAGASEDEQPGVHVSSFIADKIAELYKKAGSRLIMLDSDGTLLPFALDPADVSPDSEIMAILQALASDQKNTLVFPSGRPRETLVEWYGALDAHLAANHGGWMRRKGSRRWKRQNVDVSWKRDIKGVLEEHARRTPKTFIEEKAFSLAWHYGSVVPPLSGSKRAKDLESVLMKRIEGLPVRLIHGHKVIEVTHDRIHKGEAIRSFLENRKRDFVFYIGDDASDELAFRALPEGDHTVSIKVGRGPTAAKYSLPTVKATRIFLTKLVE